MKLYEAVTVTGEIRQFYKIEVEVVRNKERSGSPFEYFVLGYTHSYHDDLNYLKMAYSPEEAFEYIDQLKVYNFDDNEVVPDGE